MILGLSDFAAMPVLPGKAGGHAAQEGESFDAAFALSEPNVDPSTAEPAVDDDDPEPDRAEAGIGPEQSDVALPAAGESGGPDQQVRSDTMSSQATIPEQSVQSASRDVQVHDVEPLDRNATAWPASTQARQMASNPVADLILAATGDGDASDEAEPGAGSFAASLGAESEDAADARSAATVVTSLNNRTDPGLKSASQRPEPGKPSEVGAVSDFEGSGEHMMNGTPKTMNAEVVLHQSRELRLDAQPGGPFRHHMVQGHDVARQVADRLAASDQNRIEITLTPEELGKIKLVIMPGDSPRVAVYSENRETLDLLRRNAELLQDELRDTGFGDASLFFGQENQGQAPATYNKARFDTPIDMPAEPVLATAPHVSSDRRLDIRF